MTVEEIIKNQMERCSNVSNKVFSLTSIKDERPPYVLYVTEKSDEVDDLDDGTGLMSEDFSIYVVARSVPELVNLSKIIRGLLLSLRETQTEDIYVENVTVKQTAPDDRARETTFCSRVYDLHIDYQEV
ncbi:MAG: hypothetical protein IJP43_07595 [Oscillospiraceae bacterium]|nr:hypothetical protein [Oscillospiraceae bacterium]